MNKRDFIKTGLTGSLVVITGSLFKVSGAVKTGKAKFSLPQLNFSPEGISAFNGMANLNWHYNEYHGALIKKLNNSLSKEGHQPGSVREIIAKSANFTSQTEELATAHLNHKIFWSILQTNGYEEPEEYLNTQITSDYGSYKNFKSEFTNTAITSQNEWIWLIQQKNSLKIITTSEYQNPLSAKLPDSQKGTPLLCLDLCSHAYQTSKQVYVNSFWDFVNWNKAEKRFRKSINS